MRVDGDFINLEHVDDGNGETARIRLDASAQDGDAAIHLYTRDIDQGNLTSNGQYAWVLRDPGSGEGWWQPYGAMRVVNQLANLTINSADADVLGTYYRFTNVGGPIMGTAAAADVGHQVHVRNATGADVTVLAAAGVTINGNVTITDGDVVTAVIVAANEWDIIGGV